MNWLPWVIATAILAAFLLLRWRKRRQLTRAGALLPEKVRKEKLEPVVPVAPVTAPWKDSERGRAAAARIEAAKARAAKPVLVPAQVAPTAEWVDVNLEGLGE